MSFENAKRITLSEKAGIFSWGMVDNVQSIDMWPQFSPYLRNCRLDGQSIVQRPGHVLFETLTAWDYPRGIWSYLRADSANDVLLVRHNKDADEKLVTITEDWTVTNINTGTDITSENRMTFSNVWDVVYCMNGVDDFGKLSWTTYTTPATGVASFAPAFWVVFNGSHWASGRSTNPNKVYKSVADNYEDFNGAWSDQFTFQETIVWLATNNEALFYFTKNSVAVTSQWDIQETAGALTYITKPLQTKEWAVNHSSIVTAWTDVYYLSSSNSINMIARGNNIYWFEVLELSDREYEGIDWLMKTLDKDQTDSFGYFLPDVMIIKRFVKSEWAAFNDICIVYDVIHKRFLVDSNKYFYWGVFFKWKNYTISMIEEKVYIDEFANDDEDSPIPFEYWTKKFYLWWATRKNTVRGARSLFDINELAELTQNIYVDGRLADTRLIDWDDYLLQSWWIGVQVIWEWWIWTSEDWEDMVEVPITRTKGNLNVKGRTVQAQFTNSVIGSKVRLKDFTLQMERLPDLENT